MEIETLKAFADRLGVRPSYVTKLKHDGRLVLTDDGKVAIAASLARLEETADPNREDVRERWRVVRAVRAQPTGEAGQGGTAMPEAPLATSFEEQDANGFHDEQPDEEAADLGTIHGTTYAAHRVRKMKADADLAEMERDRLAGRLVEIDAVRAAAHEAGAVIRALLENLPDQLAPLVAPESEDKARVLIAEQAEAILTEYATRLEASAERITEAQQQEARK